MEKYVLFGLLALVAEVLGTVSGFGSSILFVPIASLFFDLKEVLGITALFHVFSNISKIVLFRNAIDKTLVLYLGAAAVLAVTLGAYWSKFVDTQQIELVLSVFLIVLSLTLWLKPHLTIDYTKRNFVISGLLSGFLAGLIGTGGAIRGLTLASYHLEKSVFITTSALIDFGVDSSRAVVYGLNGYYNYHTLLLVPLLLGVSVVGTYTGKVLLRHISEAFFKRIVLMVILLTGLVQVAKLLFY